MDSESIWAWITNIASIATLLSFFGSLSILIFTNFYRKEFLFLARILPQMDELAVAARGYLRELSADSRDVESIRLARSTIGPILKSARKKLSGSTRSSCKDLIRAMDKHSISEESRDQDFDEYELIQVFIHTVSEEYKDKTLRG